MIASIYDHLGLLSPVGWDKPLSTELSLKWTKLVNQTKHVSISVPRYNIGENSVKNKEVVLHGFCVASHRDNPAIVYVVSNVGEWKIGHLVACKTKVAPIKSMTTPQLELAACITC